MMVRRPGVTIVELMVVLSILAVLVGLLLPAVQSARQRARETTCKNNLHQLNLAVAQYAGVHKQIPAPGSPEIVGGWTIAILPFLEQGNLYERISPGMGVTDAPEVLHSQPRIFRCPVRGVLDRSTENTMESSHYVLVPHSRRETFALFDAPVELSVPWASGPEMSRQAVTRTTGPHHEGFFYTRGHNQGIGFIEQGG